MYKKMSSFSIDPTCCAGLLNECGKLVKEILPSEQYDPEESCAKVLDFWALKSGVWQSSLSKTLFMTKLI